MSEAVITSVAADRYDELCGRLSGVARIDEARAVTESFLPEASRISARNAAISSFYAAAYLDQPELFKWAGMAAFASNHARSLLLPLRIVTGPQGIPGWARWLLRDFETVRTINNEIFRDIFWAHAVYRGTPEGLARLCEIVGDDGPAGAIHSAFGEIERGRKEAAAGKALDGRERIWRGNIGVLRHEQEHVVQPRFASFSCGFARAFSIGSSLDFEARGWCERVLYFTSFYWHIWRRRRDTIRDGGTWPRIDKLPMRWVWIEDRLVPGFRAFEEQPDRCSAGLGRLVARCEPIITRA